METEITWNLPLHWAHACRAHAKEVKLLDSTGAKLSGKQLMLRTFALRSALRRIISPQESSVAILLPPSAPGVVTNITLALEGQTAINLNYTASNSILNHCLEVSDAKYVITSRKVMERFSFDLRAKLVYLEDVREQITWKDKLTALWNTHFASAERIVRPRHGMVRNADEAATIIFTSGSTGLPKGVVLTYENIASNIRSIHRALSLTSKDTMAGILPLFHSFGYTVSMWAPLTLGITAAYHFNPLDARQVGKLVHDSQANILLSTPTFLRNYLRRVEPEHFKSLEMLIVGAEKLPMTLSDAFEERFGIRPTEGYGMTEMGPLVSVNIPASRNCTNNKNSLKKEGSVGRPLPEVQAKFLSLDNHRELEANQEGMLYVRGKGLMPGYLKADELTNKAIRDGWYETGDIGYLDADGFIFLTGRQSRFSKIAGEMIPHGVVEEAIHEIIGGTDEEGVVSSVVTAVPDEKRGERLVVLHHALDQTADEILQELSRKGLPNIYLPSADSFFQVESIPVLGSGKLDLKAIREMALHITGSAAT